MSATCTITGVVGPGQTLTAGVFNSISIVNFNCDSNIIELRDANGKVFIIGITAATTITATKSSSTYTFTVS